MLSTIKKMNKILVKKQKSRLVILFFMMLFGAFLEVLGVSLMVPLMTAIMNPNIIEQNELIGKICAMLDLHSHKTFVIACIIALICVFIFKDLFLILQYYVQSRFVFNNRFAAQKKMFHIFMKRPYEYYLNAQTGEIMRIIQSDIGNTYALLTTLLTFATESIVSIALVATIFLMEPVMTMFVAFMMLLIMIVISKAVKPVLRREGLILQKHTALATKWLLQAIQGIKEVKVSNKEAFFEENYDKNGRLMIQAEKWNTVLKNTPRLLIEMVSICSALAVLAILIYTGKPIEELVTSFAAFAMAAVKLMPSANRIVGALNTIAYQEPSLDKMLEHIKAFEEEQEIKIPTEAAEEEQGNKITLEKEIRMKNITYQYPGSSVKVLQNAEMEIPIGKSIGIVGASGAGKTTAVDILMGLLMPQEGMILADGQDVMSDYKGWLNQISYIPQTIFMMDGTIRANVAFGEREEDLSDEKVWNALREAQMEEFVRSLPEGLDTRIGERGVRLSGGQRQRIGIARALYKNPSVLIFDEATSALDNETEAAIMESINSLHGKKTMVIIAHRLHTIEGCDRVYRVKDGKIIVDSEK